MPAKTLLSQNTSVQLTETSLEIRLGGAEARSISFQAKLRKGRELRLIVGDDAARSRLPDPSLFRLAVHALAAQQALLADESDQLVSGYTDRHLYKLLRLSWLAPEIIAAIVEGTQPPELNGRRILRAANVPLSWYDQRKLFGFD